MTAAKKTYPTAQPHRAPDDLAAQCARWRRRTFGVSAVGIVMIALASGALVFAGKEGLAAKPAPMRAPEPVSFESPPPMKIEPGPVAQFAPKKAMDLPPPKEFRKPAPTPVSVKRETDTVLKEAFLEALGSLSAAHLFQSYLNIGLLADGVESEAYTTKEAEETLTSIGEMMDQAENQLGKLTRLGLDADDAAALEQIRVVTALLRLQAKHLKDYWRSGEMDQAKQYHEVRQAAWKGLTKVLQLEAK